ncbi:hypothetical protein ACIRPK_26685 [Kitasatospora sp. NPDC101801]|uniref:hypothetical protein n=1 Tax=Kitasatospora sp. NPDC101801 TaxID=3364103 RepID=UPI003812727E
MSTQLDKALTELRTWSAPGRRAALIAAAWDAGETNVSALSEAARVSRPTVYADLRSQGIDPDHRPAKENTMLSPVILEGFTGLNLDGQEAKLFQETVYRHMQEHPGDSSGDEAGRLIGLMDALRDYNSLRPRLQEERVAREERDRALHLVEVRWEALKTAANWLAAHHDYVVTVDDARIAIDMWEDRAAGAAGVPFRQEHLHQQAAYQQILAAGHPAIEPLTIDPAAEAARLRANLEQATGHRRRLAAETVALAGQGDSR